MSDGIVSRYGVYRDLEKSPYRVTSPYGDIFKFRSQKKMDIYTREIQNEIERLHKCVDRLGLRGYVAPEIIQLLSRATYQALYDRVEG